MDNIKPRLAEKTKMRLNFLMQYYLSSRGIGHTRAMIEGARNENRPILIGGTRISAENIGRDAGIRRQDCIGWGEIGIRNLRGLRQPIVFDNYGVQAMIVDAIDAIRDLEFVIFSLKRLPYNID